MFGRSGQAALPLVLLGLLTADVGAQGSMRDSLRDRIAAEWKIESASVFVAGSDDWLSEADSVDVRPSDSDRWLVTAYGGDSVVRRFIQVGHEALKPVAARELERGAVVRGDALAFEVIRVLGAPAEAGEVDGWIAQRRIRVGEILAPPAVRPPRVVRGGDTVEALARSGAVEISARAMALNSGRIGDLVRVRLASGLELSAEAVGPGVVLLVQGDR
jgi:flagella basal body P-ring formation protein FlgA